MTKVVRLQHTSVPMPPGQHETARRFYGGALGMEEKPTPTGLLPGQLVWFRAGDDGQEVHVFTDEAMLSNSSSQHLCLQVEDLRGMRARLQQHGVEVEETIAITNRPRLFVRDPFGNQIELTQITGEYD